jgi:hypothetical protein
MLIRVACIYDLVLFFCSKFESNDAMPTSSFVPNNQACRGHYKQGLLKPILILLKAASGVISTACDVIPSDFIC